MLCGLSKTHVENEAVQLHEYCTTVTHPNCRSIRGCTGLHEDRCVWQALKVSSGRLEAVGRSAGDKDKQYNNAFARCAVSSERIWKASVWFLLKSSARGRWLHVRTRTVFDQSGRHLTNKCFQHLLSHSGTALYLSGFLKLL